MKVLLLSPLPGLDPPCGDLIYTETLLAHPPEGVEYENYAQALARGTLREHGVRRSLKLAFKTRRGIFRELVLTTCSHLINRFRKRRILFWEPFRFFSVTAGEYDLIHLHVFSARFFNLSCPLVVSNAAALRYLYTEARRYAPGRVKRIERAEILLARVLGVNLNSYYLPQATRVMPFTSFLSDWYCQRRIIAPEAIDCVPIFLPTLPAAPASSPPRRVGFIAKDFAAKGGITLLQAFEQVREARPDAELFVVGCPPQIEAQEARSRGITWITYLPRDTLMEELLPSFDVFAYPTEFDGLPLVVLEAISLGIPIAISDYQAMPEIIGNGGAGLISPVGDVPALAANILRLLEPASNTHYRQAAYAHFAATYSADVVRPRLVEAYQAAVRNSINNTFNKKNRAI